MEKDVKSLYRSCLQHFELQKIKKNKKYSTKEVKKKKIKINLDFIFNNFPMHRRFVTSIN